MRTSIFSVADGDQRFGQIAGQVFVVLLTNQLAAAADERDAKDLCALDGFSECGRHQLDTSGRSVVG